MSLQQGDVSGHLNKLPNETLRQIAVRKMEGHENAEITMQLGVTTRTIQHKLEQIRGLWT